MNTAIDSVLNRLRSHLGLSEKPNGSDSNSIVDWYNDNVDKIGNGPWCEMAMTWGMWTGGAKSLKTGRAYTVWACQDAQKCQNGSSWHWGTSGMRAGDQVYYDWAKKKGNISFVDHTGMVEQVLGDGTFYVLEGNVSNRLLRMRRDSTYVVGYVRFDWSRLVANTSHVVVPAVTRPITPKTNKVQTRRIQDILKVSVDGEWGPKTDASALLLRTAARAKFGYPKNVKLSFHIRNVQRVINTSADGIWGPKSQIALRKWIIKFQRIANVRADGVWGPLTDNAFLTIRNANRQLTT